MDEDEIIERLAQMNIKTLSTSNGITKRGQHGKHHGCVRAKFHVDADLDDEFSVGVFEPGKEYACLIRFSNGRRNDDRQKDAHGMAIKLLDVPGAKLLPGREASDAHDFLLVDHPVFFCADLSDYVVFNRHFTPFLDLSVNPFSLGRLFRGIYGMSALGLFHRSLLKRAQKFASHTLPSPLASDYHSTTPYLLGERAVKYRVTSLQPATGGVDHADGLRTKLWDEIEREGAAFEFGVVLQTDVERQPVEDASINWDTQGGAYQRIATIEIPKQAPGEDNDQLAEELVFSPWRCLKEQEPIGAINRARLVVYRTLSEFRRGQMGNRH